jgi:hypothetical protein
MYFVGFYKLSRESLALMEVILTLLSVLSKPMFLVHKIYTYQRNK